MSRNNNTPTETNLLCISNDTTAVPSASTSDHHLINIKDGSTPKPSHLDIPSSSFRRPSMASLDSTYTDLSELSFASPDHQTHHPLIQTSSHDSAYSDRPRTRIGSLLHRLWYENYGALLVLLSQFFGCLMNLSTRMLELPGAHGPGMHPFQILFARQSITSLTCTVWALYTRSIPDFPLGPKSTRIRFLLVTRGVCGFMGVFGMYFSLLYLPLSEATVLTFLAPILTCYLCSYVLPEQGSFNRSQQLAALVSLVGVVFIAQPASFFSSSPDDAAQTPSNSTIPTPAPTEHTPPPVTTAQHLSAIGISLLGVLGGTGAMTSIRAIGNSAHPFLSINYFSVFCTVMSLGCLVVFPDVKFRLPGNAVEWGLLASLGGCGFIMQWLLTRGLSYGTGGGVGVKPRRGSGNAIEDGGGLSGGVGVDVDMLTRDEADASSPRSSDIELTSIHPLKPAHSSSPPSPHHHRKSKSKHESTEPTIAGSSTRATSMVYTQMLFALAGDRLVFGVSPGMWSWIGSGFILGGAVWVAASRSDGGTSTRRKGGGGGGGAVGGELGVADRDSDSDGDGGVADRVAQDVRAARGEARGTEVGRESERVGLMTDDAMDDEDERDDGMKS